MEVLSDSALEEFESSSTVRHSKAKPPKEAYLYFPGEKEKIDIDFVNRKRSVRRIFEGSVEYTDFEREELTTFKALLVNLTIELKSWVDDSICLRFLQASGFDHEKALKMILDNDNWKRRYFPLRVELKHKEILNSGFIYVHGRDHRFRPLIVIDPSVYIKNFNKYIVEDMIYALIYFFEYIVNNLLIPGQVENWTIICNVDKFSVVSIPKELRVILGTLSNNYRCRLYQMYLLNLSFFLSMIWKGIKTMLNPTTEKKIKLLHGDQIEELWSVVNKSQVEVKLGGEAENVTSHYFPPIFPSSNYFTRNDKPEELLVSEDKYIEMTRDNPLIKLSPYILTGKENIITFNNEESVRRSEVSVYEEAKSRDYTQVVEETKFEDCRENTSSHEIKLILLDTPIDSESCNRDSERSVTENQNQLNCKSFEVDSQTTNVSNRNKIKNAKAAEKNKRINKESRSANKIQISHENVKSKASHDSSFNSKSETIGKNHPQALERNLLINDNRTNFESETRAVCCGSKGDKCLII